MFQVFSSSPLCLPGNGVLENIFQKAALDDYREGEILLAPGQLQKRIRWVKEGVVRCYLKYLDRESINWFAGEGHIVYSAECLFRNNPSSEFIEACTPVTLYSISNDDYQALLRDRPEFQEYVFKNFQDRLLSNEKRRFGIEMLTAYERYVQFMETHSFLANKIQMKFIANYLGMTPTHLSRVRREFMRYDGKSKLIR